MLLVADLTILKGTNVTVAANSNAHGNVLMDSGGTLTLNSASPITFAVDGTWTSSDNFGVGHVVATGGGSHTIQFTGQVAGLNGTITTGGATEPFPSLQISKPATNSSYALLSDLAVSGNLTVDAGASLTDNSHTLTLSTSAVVATATIVKNTNATLILNNLTTVAGAGTCQINYPLALSGDLVTQSGSTVLGATASPFSCVNLTNGATLNASAVATLSVAGNLSTSGNPFSAPTTLVFNGLNAQSANFGTNTVNSFTVSNSAGVTVTGTLKFASSGTLIGSLSGGPMTAGGLSFNGNANASLTGSNPFTVQDGDFTDTVGTVATPFVYFDTVNSAARNAVNRAFGSSLTFQSSGSGASYAFQAGTTLAVAGDLVVKTVSSGTNFTVTDTTLANDGSIGGALNVASSACKIAFSAAHILAIGGAITTGSGISADSVDLSALKAATFGGNLNDPSGTFKAPPLLTANGGTTQAINTTAPLQDFTVNGGSTASLSAGLTVSGNLITSGGFVAGANTLTLTGATKNWQDNTGVQNFGSVTIADGASISAQSNLTVENFTVGTSSGVATFNLGNSTMTVRQNFTVHANTDVLTSGAATVVFAAGTNNVLNTVTLNQQSLHNVTISKTATGSGIQLMDPAHLTGNLDVGSGALSVTKDLTVDGNALVDQTTTLTVADPAGAASLQTLTFNGQLTVAVKATFQAVRTSASANVTLKFLGGLLVDSDNTVGGATDNGTFLVDAHTTTSVITLQFGQGTSSRVGPINTTNNVGNGNPNGTNPTFAIHGNSSLASGAKNVQLVSSSPGNSWSLSYNLAIDPSDPGTEITDVGVADSNANAGNVVKAGTTDTVTPGQSDDNNNNQNWNFGGKHKLTGSIGTTTAGVKVKLYIDQSADPNGKKLHLTAQTNGSGQYTFNLTIAPAGDPFSLFVDDLTKASAGVVAGVVVSPTATFPTVQLDILQGHMKLVDQRTGANLPLLTDTILGKVDSSAANANDPDASFSVTGGTLTVNNALALDVNAPLNLVSVGLTTSGTVNVGASSQLSLGGSGNTIGGNLNITAAGSSLSVGGTTNVSGATTIGNGASNTGTLTANASTTLGSVDVKAGGTLTVSQPLAASALTVEAGSPNGVLSLNANVSVSGALVLQGTLTAGAGSPQLAGGGDITVGAGATLPAPTSNPTKWSLAANGAGAQSVNVGQAINQFLVAKASGTATLAAALSVAGSVVVSGGTFDLAGLNLTTTAGGDLVISNGTLTASGASATASPTISVDGNWALILPGVFTAQHSNVTMTGGTAQSPKDITGSVATNFYNLAVDSAASPVVKLLVDANVANVITVGTGAHVAMLDLGSATLTLSSNATTKAIVVGSGGVWTPSTSTVAYTGTAGTGGNPIVINTDSANINAGTPTVEYFNLKLLGQGTGGVFQPSEANAANPVTVLGNLTVDTAVLQLTANQALTVIGSATVSESTGSIGGKITTAAAGVTIEVDGDFAISGTTGTSSAYSGTSTTTVKLGGSTSSKLTTNGSTFNNVVVAKVGGAVLTALDDEKADTSLHVTNGTLALGANNLTLAGNSPALTVDATGAITQTAASGKTITVTTGSVMANGPIGADHVTFNGGTTTYNGTSTLTIADRLTVDTGTLAHQSGSIVINGSDPVPFTLANGGTYSAAAGGGSLTLASSGTATVPTTASTYNNLTLASGAYSIGGTLTVQGSFTIQSGTFSQSTNTIRFTQNTPGTLNSGGQTLGILNVDKSGGTLTLGASLATTASTGNVTVTNGTLELNAFTLNVGGNLQVNAGAALDDSGTTASDLTVQGATMQVDGSSTTFDLVLPGATSLNTPANSGTITVKHVLNATGLLTLGANMQLLLSGANTPLSLSGGLTANASSTVTYQSSGAAATTITSGVTYGKLVVQTGTGFGLGAGTTTVAGAFTLQGAATLSTGTNMLALGASAAGTVKSGATFDLNHGTLSGTGAATFAVQDTSSFNAATFTISGFTSGVNFGETTNVALSSGTINVPQSGTGLVFRDRSVAGAPTLQPFSNIAFMTANFPTVPARGFATNVSIANYSGSTTPPFPFTITFKTSFTGFEYDQSNVAVIGNLWGNRFDSDPVVPSTLPQDVSQGMILWNNGGTAPQIVSVTTQDADGDGSIDHIQVVFDQPVAALNAAGFSIGGVLGASASAANVSVTTIALASQVVGTEPKTVNYSAAAGGAVDFSGNALATESLVPGGKSLDGAGPVIITAEYDNKNTTDVTDDTLKLTFSEPLTGGSAAFPASVSDFTIGNAGGFVLSGSFASSGSTTTISQTGGGAAAPTVRGTTIKFSGTTVKDPSGNAPAGNNAAVALIAPLATPSDGLFDFNVSVPGQTDRSAGDAIQVVLQARNINGVTGTAMPNFTPKQGLVVQVFDNAGATNPDLGTKPTDFTNFVIGSSQGGTFDTTNAATTGAVVITGVSFDQNGNYSLNVFNTKATKNVANDVNAQRVRVRVTDIADAAQAHPNGLGTGVSGILPPNAGAIAWQHATPANLIVLLGADADQDREILFQGVRTGDIAVAVSPTAARFERAAGVVFTARVFQTDQYFNLTTLVAGPRSVSLTPVAVTDDPHRSANLAGTDGNPLDTPQQAAVSAGAGTASVKNFLSALNHQLVPVDNGGAPKRTVFASSSYDVYPGAVVNLAVVLPQQTLDQGVANGVNPVEGTPFGNDLVAQGNPFVAQVVAVDAHGNWAFNYPDPTTSNAIIVKTNDSVTGTAINNVGDAFDQDTVAQRFGTSLSAIGAGTVIPNLAAPLKLDFNGQADTFDLANRNSGVEIRDLLQSDLGGLSSAAGNLAQTTFFPSFNRYLVRNGVPPTASVPSAVVAEPSAANLFSNLGSPPAQVDILRLGLSWLAPTPSTGTLGNQAFGATPARGATEFPAPLYTPTTAAADLAQADTNGPLFSTLEFDHGIAFVSARSDVQTVSPTANRLLVVATRVPVNGMQQFLSDGFQVTKGALLVASTAAFDMNPRDGAIDTIVITFQSSDTIDALAASQLTPADFKLSLANQAGTVVRSGASVSANEAANTLTITFSPGIPTTATTGLKLVGPAQVKGKLTSIDLSGGITNITDSAPPFVIATQIQQGVLVVTFSEDIQFAAPRGVIVSGIFDGVPAVGPNETITVNDNGHVTGPVSFGTSGSVGVANILGILTGAGLDASFENNRFVIRSNFISNSMNLNTSLAPVVTGTANALSDLRLDNRATSKPGVFSPSTGQIDDFLVLSQTGVDLRGGVPAIVGNQLIIPLANQNGDLTPPFFAFVDNFTQGYIQDLAAQPNFLGASVDPASHFLRGNGIFSNVPGLETQNVASGSGFLRARERDNIPGDGIFENTPPGFFETDIAASPIPAGLVQSVEVDAIAPLAGQAEPVVLFPANVTLPLSGPLAMGSSLAHTQVGLVLLGAGNYAITYRVTLTGNLPIGLAVTSANQLVRTFTVQVLNLPPVARTNLGPIVVAAGHAAVLDGSTSFDPNGDAVNYTWTQVSGPSAAPAPGNAAQATVTPPSAGVYVYQLKADDGTPGNSTTAQVTVVAQTGGQHVPTADAGLDQVVITGQGGVKLDGGESVDPDGHGLTYTWAQTAGPAVALSINAASPAVATFNAPSTAAFLIFQLVVSDGVLTSPAASVAVIVNDEIGGSRPPSASFDLTTGSDFATNVPFLFGRVDRRLELSAGASLGLPRVAKFDWHQTSGPTVTLDVSGDTASFVPPQPATYRFALAGENAQGVAGRPFEIDVRVLRATDTPAVASIAPLPASTVEVGTAVSLVGSSSVGGVSASWRQTAGPLTPVSDPTQLTVQVTPGVAGVYTYELEIVDPATNATDRATVTFGANNSAANDRLPVASFQTVANNLVVGQSVNLAASGSDPNSPASPLFISFVETAGLPSFLTGSTTGASGQSFTGAVPGQYTFEAVVSNGKRRSLPISQTFNIAAQPAAAGGVVAQGTGGHGGGGCSVAAGTPAGTGAGALAPIAALVIGLALARGLRSRRIRVELRKTAFLAALLALVSLGSGCASGLIGAIIALTGGSKSHAPDLNHADLTLSGVDGPTVAMAVDSAGGQTVVFLGDSGQLVADIVNQGNEGTLGTFPMDWYLSRTKAVDATAFKVRTLEVTATLGVGDAHRAVSPGGAEPIAVPVKAGTHLDPGRYHLIGRVNNPNALFRPEQDNSNDTNNDFLSSTIVEVYHANAPLPAAAAGPDLAITRLDVPTAALAGAVHTGNLFLTNLNAPIAGNLNVGYQVFVTPSETLAAPAVLVGSGAFTITPTAIETPVRATVVFETPLTGSFLVAVSLTAADADLDNNFRFASTPTTFYATNVIFDNGANLPLTTPGDPTLLDITQPRPPLATSLAAGGQRTLAFTLPDNGIDPVVAQMLITVSSADFDPIAELVSPAGDSIAVVDDFAGEHRAVIYSTLTAPRTNRTFFIVVSSADAQAGGSFTVSFNVNEELLGDDEPVIAHNVGNFLDFGPTDVDAQATIAIPFTFRALENEFLFTVPAAGRFPLSLAVAGATKPLDDTFLDPVRTVLLKFDEGGNSTSIPLAIDRGPNGSLLLNSLEGDGLFSLTPGAYVLILRAQFLPFQLDQPFDLRFGPGIRFDNTVK
jgi:hypothetical protein